MDDLSCFLIDGSSTHTPRTLRNSTHSPITESRRRKVIQYVAYSDGVPDNEYDHGIYILFACEVFAGTWCGGASIGDCIDVNLFPMASHYNGLAPKAKLTMFDVKTRGEATMNVPSLSKIALPPAYLAGVRVHSNSWGSLGTSGYTSMALDVDDFMYRHSDFLFVAAAGNSGNLGMNSVLSPGISKNALTVGASAKNHDYIVYFSGIGADFKGPIKPDVIGPGTELWSAGVGQNDSKSCNIQISSGTSMATPIIASSALLVKEYFENSRNWGEFCNVSYISCPHVHLHSAGIPERTHISAALVKAILVHSATDMKRLLSSFISRIPSTNLTEPPDRFQGWGQMILNNALPTRQRQFDLYVEDYQKICSMTKRTMTVIVTDDTEPLKVTIAWNDPPNLV